MNLGRALMALGREDESRHYMEEFQRVRPQRSRGPRLEPGMIESATLAEPVRVDREIERLREAARDHRDDPELQLHLALLLLADDRAAQAAPEFRRLLKLQGDTRIWQQAGEALLQAEQYELAREFLQRAAAEAPAARLDLAIAIFLRKGRNRP